MCLSGSVNVVRRSVGGERLGEFGCGVCWVGKESGLQRQACEEGGWGIAHLVQKWG